MEREPIQINEELTRVLSDILDLVDDGLLVRNIKKDEDGLTFALDGLRLVTRLKAGQRALKRARGQL